MKLSDAAVRNAKANGKVQKLSDGGGLNLHVTATGSKLWRLPGESRQHQKTQYFFHDKSFMRKRTRRVQVVPRRGKSVRQADFSKCSSGREEGKKGPYMKKTPADHAGGIMAGGSSERRTRKEKTEKNENFSEKFLFSITMLYSWRNGRRRPKNG